MKIENLGKFLLEMGKSGKQFVKVYKVAYRTKWGALSFQRNSEFFTGLYEAEEFLEMLPCNGEKEKITVDELTFVVGENNWEPVYETTVKTKRHVAPVKLGETEIKVLTKKYIPMLENAKKEDTESCHRSADGIACEILEAVGLVELAEKYRDITSECWHA